jgi:hypothetical protein
LTFIPGLSLNITGEPRQAQHQAEKQAQTNWLNRAPAQRQVGPVTLKANFKLTAARYFSHGSKYSLRVTELELLLSI